MRVFVTGATGALGRHLVPGLVAAGHEVTATTRSPGKTGQLRAAGAEPAVVDGLDRDAVIAAVRAAAPEVIVHQMTALGAIRTPRRVDKEFAVTNALRTTGTGNLLAAAAEAGTRRVVAQSFTGWANDRAGGPVKTEDDPLGPPPARSAGRTLAAIKYVEEAVPASVPEGIVLRYGGFYGPGASEYMLAAVRKRQLPVIGGGTGIWSFIEITDAAAATVAAVERGAPGVYNITDSDPAPVSEWLPYLVERMFLRRTEFMTRTGTPVWIGEFGPVYTGDPASDAQRYELLGDQLRIYDAHGAGWSLWTYKDLGLQGLVTVPPGSPYARRIADVLAKKKRLGTDAWGGTDRHVRHVLEPLEKLVASEFPDFAPYPWGQRQWIARLIREILLAEPLVEEFAARFAGVSPSEAEELAGSFAYQDCDRNERIAALVKRHANGQVTR